MTTLSSMERDVLRSAAGEPVRLDYGAEMRDALARLRKLKLIACVMEDDQPTHYATDAGVILLEQLRAHAPVNP